MNSPATSTDLESGEYTLNTTSCKTDFVAFGADFFTGVFFSATAFFVVETFFTALTGADFFSALFAGTDFFAVCAFVVFFVVDIDQPPFSLLTNNNK